MRFQTMKTDRRRDVLGIPIDLVSMPEVLEGVLSLRESRRCGCVTLVNPHSVVRCARDKELYSAILHSDLALPDGVGITMAARLLGYGSHHRVPGPSLLLNLCDLGRQHGLRHFFYGGAEGVAAALAVRLAERYRGLIVSGFLCPPFHSPTPAEDAALIDRINATAPDVVWVGLGTGKQEKWMASHAARLRACALIGVGAAFNFHAGNVPWAPAWVRDAGLEWAYRLAHEPSRLWRRNLDSFVFLASIIVQAIGRVIRDPAQIVESTSHALAAESSKTNGASAGDVCGGNT
jgi:N-acetylglucosaminyldiphosphoundecaprenol N-acetyl-beta-D-mannosaminyltransferase